MTAAPAAQPGSRLAPRLAPRLALLGFLPDQRPLPRYLCILIDGLAEAGVEIDLLFPPGGPAGDLADDLGVSAAVQVFPLEGADDRRALGELRSYLAERRPQAILSNRDRGSALLARVPRDERPLTVLRIGTNVIEKLKGKHLLSRWLARRRLADVFVQADALIGVSAGACAALRELLQGRVAPPIVQIYNPMDLAGFRRLAEAPIDHPWLADPGAPVIVSVGRLVRAKDYPTLIHAFALLRRRLDCRLIILGEGRQRPKLEALVRRLGLTEAVDLPGHAANPFAYMARARVLALSSVFEGNPNVLIEAMAVGTPCVATDCKSGPRETLGGGRFGRLVPTGDAPALAEALLQTIQGPRDPDLLGEAVRPFDRDLAIAAYLRTLGLERSATPGGKTQ